MLHSTIATSLCNIRPQSGAPTTRRPAIDRRRERPNRGTGNSGVPDPISDQLVTNARNPHELGTTRIASTASRSTVYIRPQLENAGMNAGGKATTQTNITTS